jgi:hypothetical protein
MKTALLPATRVTPALRKRVESLLHEEETVSGFVEAAVTRYAELRAAQQEFLARGHDAEAADDWVSPEQVFKAVRKSAAAAKKKRTTR